MARLYDRSHLLDVLQGLYLQIASQITALRQAGYRPKVPASSGDNVVAQLHSYLKQVPVTTAKESSAVIQESTPFIEPGTKTQKPRSKTATTAEPNNLSDTFCKRHSEDALQTSVSEKLQCSAWDHLHASIRRAREGDFETAQLHVSIMDSALKEVEQYISDKDYREFVQSLEKKITFLTHNKG